MIGLLLTGLAINLFVRQRYYYSLLIFFGLVSNGFQVIPPLLLMAGAPVDKLTDLALIYTLVLLIYRFDIFWSVIHRETVFKWVLAFFLFVLADAFYSWFILDYGFSGILKLFRANLFLLSFTIFFIVPTPVLIRVLQSLGAVTVVQCVIFLLQIPLNQTLLTAQASGGEAISAQIEGFGFTRFYNSPVFLTPFLFYYLFVHQFRSKTNQITTLAILLMAVVAPMHRSYIITLFAITVLYVLIVQKNKRVIYLAAMGVVVYIGSLVDVVQYRVNSAFTDLNRTFSGSMSLSKIDYTDNTFSFRIAHLLERFDYVISDPSRWLFGIGLLGEDTAQANKLPFTVGIFQERYDRVAQIETGDIPWSLLLLQVGLIGSIFYLILLIRLVKHFQQYKKSPFSIVGLLWACEAIVSSILGAEIIMIPFRALLLFLAVLAIKSSTTIPPARPAKTYFPGQPMSYSPHEALPV